MEEFLNRRGYSDLQVLTTHCKGINHSLRPVYRAIDHQTNNRVLILSFPGFLKGDYAKFYSANCLVFRCSFEGEDGQFYQVFDSPGNLMPMADLLRHQRSLSTSDSMSEVLNNGCLTELFRTLLRLLQEYHQVTIDSPQNEPLAFCLHPENLFYVISPLATKFYLLPSFIPVRPEDNPLPSTLHTFLAPEILLGRPYSSLSSTIWSIGAVLLALSLQRGICKEDMCCKQDEQWILRENWKVEDLLSTDQCNRWLENLNAELRDVIRHCLHLLPESRQTLQDLTWKWQQQRAARERLPSHSANSTGSSYVDFDDDFDLDEEDDFDLDYDDEMLRKRVDDEHACHQRRKSFGSDGQLEDDVRSGRTSCQSSVCVPSLAGGPVFSPDQEKKQRRPSGTLTKPMPPLTPLTSPIHCDTDPSSNRSFATQMSDSSSICKSNQNRASRRKTEPVRCFSNTSVSSFQLIKSAFDDEDKERLRNMNPEEVNMLYYQACVLLSVSSLNQLIYFASMPLSSRASLQSQSLAALFVMRIYAHGLAHQPRNMPQALRFYQRGQLFMREQLRLTTPNELTKYVSFLYSTCHAYGIGEVIAHDKVIACCELSASLGYSSALNYLAYCYKTGEHAPKNLDKALYYYRLAAEAGHAGANWQLGNWYEHGKTEIHIHRDPMKALLHYQASAEQGHYIAMNNLGTLFYLGKNPLRRDLAMAAFYYKQSIKQGNYHLALNNLGSCYYYGEGVRKNRRRAVYYYKRAALYAPYYAPAQFNLAVCLEFGEGLDKDVPRAMQYYRASASQGYCEAQYCLARHYEQGTNGLSKDVLKAVELYKLAADQGLFDARSALQRLLHKH
eukprot:scaffold1769_cov164-Ochromonas_danica.AAC.1